MVTYTVPVGAISSDYWVHSLFYGALCKELSCQLPHDVGQRVAMDEIKDGRRSVVMDCWWNRGLCMGGGMGDGMKKWGMTIQRSEECRVGLEKCNQ